MRHFLILDGVSMQQSTSTELENAEEVVIFTTLKSRLPSLLQQLQPGAYLGGGHCAMAHPFGVPVIHKYLRIVRKIESCPSPSPLTFGRKSGQKNGLNLSEDLFLLIFITLKFPGLEKSQQTACFNATTPKAS